MNRLRLPCVLPERWQHGVPVVTPVAYASTAGVNAAAAGLDGGYAIAGLIAGTTFEIPVAGEVALVGTGLYLGADYLYHHWTPFRDVANDVGHAVASTAKDAWHDVTSFF
jgi:hypothetical protein